MTTPGRFIALEGGDGAGKGSVLRALQDRLTAAGVPVLATCEPGGTHEGRALRAMLLAQAGWAWLPEAELLLMMAARVQHVRQVIQPALAQGTTVLCDRFVASTLAYQGGGRGMDAALIERLHRDVVGGILPDQTLWLDVDPAIGLRRSRRRLDQDGSDEGRFESLDLSFHQRVRTAYADLAVSCAGWTRIDASQPLVQVIDDAWRSLGVPGGARAEAQRS